MGIKGVFNGDLFNSLELDTEVIRLVILKIPGDLQPYHRSNQGLS